MTNTQKLPACSRYIDKEKASDTLYTLAKYVAPKQLPDTDAAGFHSLLCAAGIISPDSPLPEKKEGTTCFQVATEHKCGHMCQMCDYSSRNKNRLEAEESILLAYALKGWSCFQRLKKEGLKPEHFHAVFLLNEMPQGRTVPTLPLFRLAYSFLERMGTPTLRFSDLPVMIACALDQNNPGKLLPQNVQTVMEYLQRLQAGSSSVKQERISEALLQVLCPEQEPAAPVQKEQEAEAAPCDSPEPNKADSVSSECIDGLLSPMSSVPAKGKARKNPMSAASEAAEAGSPVASPIGPDPGKLECTEPSRDVAPTAPSAPPDDSAPAAPPAWEEILFLPSCFSAHDSERTGYPFHAIEENPANLQQLAYFLQFNPLLGMEIVTDSDNGAAMVLLCASNQFYYIPCGNEQAVSLFHTYFSKSSVRRQICMDPYRVYHFLQKNDICCQNVYSLRQAYRVMSQAKGKTRMKKPAGIISELVSKDNIYSHSPYVFAMLQYVRMYEVLSAHALMQARPQAERLRALSFIDMFLGISYELGDVADTAGCLFELDENLAFRFRYRAEVKMKDGMLAVNFAFSSGKPVHQLVFDLLGSISRKRMPQLYGFRLLRHSQDSFAIATPEEHYAQLCDAVANLAAFLAEKMNLLPISIKETIL